MDGMIEQEQKIIDFEKELSVVSGSLSVIVSRFDEDGERVNLPTIKDAEIRNIEELLEIVRKRYMKGRKKDRFFFQLRTASGFSKGFTIAIENPSFEEPVLAGGSSQEIKKDDDFKAAVLEILKAQSVQKQPGREEFLRELQIYKELFGSKESSMDVTKIYSDMAKAMRDGFQLGMEFKNPAPEPEEEKSGFQELIPALSQLISGFFNRNQTGPTVSQPVYQPAPEKPKTPPADSIQPTPQDDDMMMIFSIVAKIKKTAKMPAGEDRDYRIDLIADEILEFFPQVKEAVLIPFDLRAVILDQAGRYGMSITEPEIETAKTVWEKIKEKATEV